MMGGKRVRILLLSALALVAIVVLSAGISNLVLLPARPIAHRTPNSNILATLFGGLPSTDILGFLFAVLYFFMILALPFAIIYFIISPEARKRVLRSLGLTLWLIAFYLVLRNRPDLFEQLQLSSPAALDLGDIQGVSLELAATPPQWLVWVTTVGIPLLLALTFVGGLWFLLRRRRPPESALEQLAQEAQEALDALQAGANVKDTVLRCYFDMSLVLSEQRGIRREETMTPREFERYLKEVGLAEQHVEQLTRLFESVRYGDHLPGEQEERQAIACLTAIVEACRSPRASVVGSTG